MKLSFHRGKVEGHAFRDIRMAGRYKSVAEPPVSNEALLDACRILAKDTSDWKQAENASEFAYEQWRQRELVEAIRTLPLANISCTTIDGMSCNYGRNDLMALIRNTPPDYSHEIFVPEEGALYVYRYHEPEDREGTGYTVTMRTAFRGKPATIKIRFERQIRSVV